MNDFSKYSFPDPRFADEKGLLAVGGDLSFERLKAAYQSGIFPWYNPRESILWWSPDPRFVLFPKELHISHSMRPLLNQKAFKVTFNQDFEKVIEHCAQIHRPGQEGTWLIPEMVTAYKKLHQERLAHSVEVWKEGRLVGGLYGVYLYDKGVFCGESMFSKESNASKYGFITMVKALEKEGLKLIDCQIYTPHLKSLGGRMISREKFLSYLK